MKIKVAVAFICVLMCAKWAQAQDTLPRFSVEDMGGGRVVVSWANPYGNLIQLAVQRSYDSVKRFTTLYSAPSPELPVNGFSDKIVPGVRVFYRIFYVMKGGSYYFTKSMRPGTRQEPIEKEYDSRRDKLGEDLLNTLEKKDSNSVPVHELPIFVKTKDTLLSLMPAQFKLFRDSILTQTKDSLLQQSADTVFLQPYEMPFIQQASQYVFTDRDGFIVIKLPDIATKKYELLFLEENDTPVLELRNLKEPHLTLDKINFYHGGWYKFELIENGKVKERNKIYLPVD